MKNINTLALVSAIVLFAAFSIAAQNTTAPKVTNITMPANSNSGQVEGNLKDGQKIALRWAEQSNVACFPGTRFEMFDGNHVLYRVAMPAGSRITVTVTPKTGKSINLYALRQGANETAAPPNISRAISCEASYPIYANKVGGGRVSNEDDGKRKIEYISVGSPYSILIGVAGANGLAEGDFTLGIEITGR